MRRTPSPIVQPGTALALPPRPGAFLSALLARWLGAVLLLQAAQALNGAEPSPEAAQLASEVSTKGWLLYAAKTPAGSYDLFLARPDGSHVRNLTQTPEFTEFGGKFSPDGKKLLYRRVAKSEEINHDLWGASGTLMLARR